MDEPVFSLAADPQPPAAEIPAPVAQPAAPVVPSSNLIDVPTEVKGEEIAITLGDRRYRVRGLAKNLSYDLIKVNLLASRGDGFHVDTLDLYAARQRTVVYQTGRHRDGHERRGRPARSRHVLRKLEELQDEQIRKTLEPKQRRDRASARRTAPRRWSCCKIPPARPHPEDFARCGVVGEETNKLVGYIAAMSRHLEAPLAVIVQSSSAAGKSSLMEAILAFVPEEHRIEYSAMTGQSLFYMG